MGDITEIQQAKKWIYDSLVANTDIAAAVSTRVYADYVPEPPANRTYPYIVFDFLGGTDRKGVGRQRLLTVPLFQVRVVTQGRPDTVARKIDKRIDDILQNAANQPSGDYYFSSEREQPVDRPETDQSSGLKYHNLGGLFRLYIGRTP
jgi:hypothetical protein